MLVKDSDEAGFQEINVLADLAFFQDILSSRKITGLYISVKMIN